MNAENSELALVKLNGTLESLQCSYNEAIFGLTAGRTAEYIRMFDILNVTLLWRIFLTRNYFIVPG